MLPPPPPPPLPHATFCLWRPHYQLQVCCGIATIVSFEEDQGQGGSEKNANTAADVRRRAEVRCRGTPLALAGLALDVSRPSDVCLSS